MNLTTIGLGSGFAIPAIAETTQTSVIGGKKIREKKGKLTKDLGKPALQATAAELDSYVNKASGAEKKKRVARVNLAKAHLKGHKAKGDKLRKPHKGKAKTESVAPNTVAPTILMQALPVFAVVERRHGVACTKAKSRR